VVTAPPIKFGMPNNLFGPILNFSSFGELVNLSHETTTSILSEMHQFVSYHFGFMLFISFALPSSRTCHLCKAKMQLKPEMWASAFSGQS